jgi:hypothetical protein
MALGCFDDLMKPVRSEGFGRTLEQAFERTRAGSHRATVQEIT